MNNRYKEGSHSGESIKKEVNEFKLFKIEYRYEAFEKYWQRRKLKKRFYVAARNHLEATEKGEELLRECVNNPGVERLQSKVEVVTRKKITVPSFSSDEDQDNFSLEIAVQESDSTLTLKYQVEEKQIT